MNKSFLAKFMFVFGIVMIAVYIGLGVSLIFFPIFMYIPQNMKTIFGIFFLAYGFFRLVRFYMKFKEKRDE